MQADRLQNGQQPAQLGSGLGWAPPMWPCFSTHVTSMPLRPDLQSDKGTAEEKNGRVVANTRHALAQLPWKTASKGIMPTARSCSSSDSHKLKGDAAVAHHRHAAHRGQQRCQARHAVGVTDRQHPPPRLLAPCWLPGPAPLDADSPARACLPSARLAWPRAQPGRVQTLAAAAPLSAYPPAFLLVQTRVQSCLATPRPHRHPLSLTLRAAPLTLSRLLCPL